VTTTAAIIPAGGASRRLGRPKLLLEYQGETLLRRAVKKAAGVAGVVVVVVGAYPEPYGEEARRAGALVLENTAWREGLAASLRAGFHALPPEIDVALVILPDQPLVTPNHLRALLARHRRSGAPLVFSRYQGLLGAPALIQRTLFPAVQTLRGDRGARALLEQASKVAEVPLSTPEDVDTPEDAARLLGIPLTDSSGSRKEPNGQDAPRYARTDRGKAYGRHSMHSDDSRQSDMNPLRKLQDFGQSLYLDEIRRSMISGGYLKTLIDRDGLRGVTSNPAIFEKAIAQSDDYDDAIAALARQGKSVPEIYEELVVEDIQGAADLLRPLYDDSDGRYGYVSLEVSPLLAHDSEGTVREARHLWRRLERPNVFIKVPGTSAGLPAIRRLIGEGINVNVTLLFGLERYRQVAEAYLAGLQARAAAGEPLARTASVASFFLSRIDVMIDPLLEASARQGGKTGEQAEALRGHIAVASAKCAYRIYREVFGGERFAALQAQGAREQRLLWASTSTKNPDYSDTMYVEPLIGPNTINTMPSITLDAYRDHGNPAPRIEEGGALAEQELAQLAELGIDLDAVTQRLEDEGVEKFIKPFESLMETLRAAAAKTPA